MTLRKKIPTANVLFTFEAAAKTLNFTEAGQRLNVTQPAVSKSIGLLEKTLAVKLFNRHKTTLSLTPAGKKLYRAVSLAFGSVEDVIDQISAIDRPNDNLTLSVSTAFAAHWLIPQLDAFRREFPDISLNFQLASGEVSGGVAPCDLGLRLETKIDSGDHAVKFCPEQLIAVASPDYLEKYGMLNQGKPGAKHSIVTLSEARITWDTFLAKSGQSINGEPVEMEVPDYSVVLQTALNGRSAALGFTSACGYLLKEGLLVPVLPVFWQTGKSYSLVSPEPLKEKTAVYELREWLLQRNTACMSFLDTIHIHQ